MIDMTKIKRFLRRSKYHECTGWNRTLKLRLSKEVD